VPALYRDADVFASPTVTGADCRAVRFRVQLFG